MEWLGTALLVVQLITAIAVIVLVLLQHGKGADMGAAFGGGSSGSLFGATGSANFLSRTTAWFAAIFFACTLGLALTASRESAPSKGSVISDIPTPSAPAQPSSDVPTPSKPGEIPK